MTAALVRAAGDLAEAMAGLDLRGRIRLVEDRIPGRLVFTTSLGIEDQALTHALALNKGRTEIVTLDTGRLYPETYDVWTETEAAYGIRIRAYAPERVAEEEFVAREGINGFRHSVAARQACCGFRKVEPLGRALTGAAAWFTGLRAGQSANRADTPLAEADEGRGLIKVNPLADWTRADVDRFVRDNFIPYNALHDRGFPSIGCAPCTRAVKVGEDERAGRWWWEQESKKECGLHLHRPEGDVAPGQEAAAFEEPASAATSREHRKELV
ncbi:phosphoadenylyl-sulfate reductase [Methylorubrum extorquens]|uniref:phosphoadenylyl-sulfate reductase n=1 Tax=Methylorubrum extorquens TaxID=408 RepID=UPI000158EE72|nr:phosphoadenylyl-sulfate reductase [Methylorubrum extorquens]KQP87384.1 phosphoadenosine phosphosulfate reductase [Methylobacterium sp. Leaf119]MDF9865526.1 phosphoadenosine phosphosulfate reductase [Methylorubrum pseudosasae]MDH6639094.1 phosphoadenosine phosphosulfate reductase [Methylobacterium sp. SuP10 SLI 274]MDH6668284.1 phosphoadenosine phosphosulfate reductase [Methylorubrum zatmanii]ABY30629.1 adenylylsulfate reductase, thioredoxin dependent [Methylorubrum extorquens PA1]